MFFINVLAPALMLCLTMSVDAFAASFAYGSDNIKIPLRSIFTVNAVCTPLLGVSMAAGRLLQGVISDRAAAVISCCILFILGVAKLLEGVVKAFLRRREGYHRKIRFSAGGLRFILSVYADPRRADSDGSRVLSPREALALALALAIDGLGIGVGAALGGFCIPLVLLLSFVTDFLALWGGAALGRALHERFPAGLWWLGGVMLIVMAVTRLI